MLPAAAEWLRRRYAPQQGMWDLSPCVLATSGARAARRLLEILVESAGDAALIPPQIVTLGDLPELLYEPPQDLRIAGDLQALLARAHALSEADTDLIRFVVPHPPARDDFTGWLTLARQLQSLSRTLAADGVRVSEVAGRLAAALPDFADESRWEALTQLEEAYETTLAANGLIDREAARFAAIEAQRCRTEHHIVLIATADLNRTLHVMLRQVAPRVTALVHAPADRADAFDELGALRVEAWDGAPLPLSDEMIRLADQPRDQAGEVLRVLRELAGPNEANGAYRADQITVGLGDEALAPTVQRTLELAGIHARHAAGRAAAVTAPVLLLRAIARFAGADQRFDDFAALLRHPDLERYLIRRLGRIEEARTHWLTLLDRYVTESLQRRLTGTWLGRADVRAAMERLFSTVTALLPAEANRRLPLPHWSQPIAEMLARIYDEPLNRHAEDDAPLVRVLQMIGDGLRETAQLDPDAAMTPRVTFSQAIDVLLDSITGATVPSESDEAAIEMLGWLELQLDDAPVLIITGFNEGAIPQSRTADMFLPDSVRRVLGLADNRRRLARDRMMLEAIVSSRPHVTLIAGRRTAEGDPLKPSRLLLLEDPQRLAQRIEHFYAQPPQHADDSTLSLLNPGERSAFLVPLPEREPPVLRKLHVTAFRDYLACPYRFYLKHVLKLEACDDEAVELDGAHFGTLAHEVLAAFGRSDLARETDPQRIADFLMATLDERIARRYGKKPGVAVILQCEQLRYRLEHFAYWQARQSAEGWRIDARFTENALSATLEVDGEPFVIEGRIDRVDVHDTHGYRVVDYKTADSPKSPDDMHRRGPVNAKEWVDLQLPLYHHLIAAHGVDGPVSLGYVQLPKDVSKIGFDAATWSESELVDATEKACRIIQLIRAGVFWKPADPSGMTDDFSAICMDECLSRQEAIAAATTIWLQQGGGA